MGLFDSLFGRKDDDQHSQNRAGYGYQGGREYDERRAARPQNADEQAIARYRYMLQTAPPEELEQAHAEAFARLTPEQRRMVLEQVAQTVPENERRNLSDDPRSLARAATRAEMREPGTMERMMGGRQMGGGMGMGGGMMGGMGGMLAGSLLASVAGGFIGSSIANSFFSNPMNEQGFQGSPEAAAVDGGVGDYNAGDFQETGLDSSADPYGDPEAGLQDAGLDSSADPYGDPGMDDGGFVDTGFDGGGDFGGGDFGGGDF